MAKKDFWEGKIRPGRKTAEASAGKVIANAVLKPGKSIKRRTGFGSKSATVSVASYFHENVIDGIPEIDNTGQATKYKLQTKLNESFERKHLVIESSQCNIFADADFSVSKAKYLFYDDETANSKQNICAAGFICTDSEGRELFRKYQLINPENAFGSIETRIHGIDESDVKGKINFPIFYTSNDFQKLLSTCIVVMHNAASADLAHIRKSCQRYNLDMPNVSYFDTMELSKQITDIDDHKLKTVCSHYGVHLEDHHNALADAQACYEIFWKMAAEFGLPEEPSTYNPRNPAQRPHEFSHQSSFKQSQEPTINGSNQPLGEVFEKFKFLGLLADDAAIEKLGPCPMVFSGTAYGFSKTEIQKMLVERGYSPKKKLSRNTKFLAAGDNAGQSKIDDAESRGISIFPLTSLVDMLEHCQ